MEIVSNLHIITNNIKGIQNKNKCLSIIKYFKNKIGKKEIYFYLKHETWRMKSVDPLFIHIVFLTLVVYWLSSLGKIKYVHSQITDKNARILILNLTLDQSEYIPVNIYKENTESKQLEKFEWYKWTHEKVQYNIRKANCFSR